MLYKDRPDIAGVNQASVKLRRESSAVELADRHHNIIRRLLLGESNKSIAEALGVSVEMVSNIKRSPVVAERLSLMQAAADVEAIDCQAEIAKLAPLAVQKVTEALKTGKICDQQLNGSKVVDIAHDILDRELGKPTQRVETKNLHAVFTAEDLEDIKSRIATMKLGYTSTEESQHF